MTLSSMTGFARADGSQGAWRWSWELKSVNGRNLEIRLRFPPGHDRLEGPARKALQARVKRGSIYAALTTSREAGTSELRINDAALTQVLGIMNDLKTRTDATPPTLDGILALRGILETGEPEETEEDREARGAAILASFDQAIDGLVVARDEEGLAIGAVVADQVAEIARLSVAADKCAAVRPEALRTRIKDQVEAIMGAGRGLSEERLHQELALLATKADVREEIDRLKAHVTAAKELLTSADPVGRKLDFLAQEFNREANTLCSKAGDIELTQLGLELKAVIDQLREQVQNLE